MTTTDFDKEYWEQIPGFDNYEISSNGQVMNMLQNKLMRKSKNNYGHQKITLVANDGERYTRSVTQLVADAFIRPYNILCDTVLVLDGNHDHIDVENLVWRPRWFAWKYTKQLKQDQPPQFLNLPCKNLTTGSTYGSIVEAGMAEGLLFMDIWRSSYTGHQIFPGDLVFEIITKEEM